ncbi:hypothetical protein V1387_02200 [Allomuricauda taeanensis]|uniref:hypothetical protein n=1 Tax=Flagellimonas taeanensis TaxID=1005926 RepID=UPI002E7AEE0A|nr:hypothetical protein [Allomuricauda taeanensis]MEE1961481.1 hypothetical protein [Allomuricauda taeanensis]
MEVGEVDFVDRIIVKGDFEIAFPCQTDIIRNTLETESSLNALIANTFDMDDEDSVDLIYSSEALTEGELDLIGAKADIVFYNPGNPNSLYYISVNFDQDYLSYATDLSIASVTLHENVHAYLLYALEENEDWLIEGSSDNINYEILLESYIDYRAYKIYGTPLKSFTAMNFSFAHHEVITEFVEEIASTLREYGENQGYTLGNEFYNAMAWGGLKETLAWTLDLTEQKRQQYENIFLSEHLGVYPAKGTNCGN